MPDHRLPVHPSLLELEQEAEALVRDGVLLPAAQQELAQSYEAPDWARLALACRLLRKSNWGPPMSYVAERGGHT